MLQIVALFFGASALAVAIIAWLHRGVIGYQDELGFHYGEPRDASLDVLEWPGEQDRRKRA